MTKQLAYVTRTAYRASLLATGLLLVLAACGRSSTTAPEPLITNNPLSGSNPTGTDTDTTATTSYLPAIPTTGTGTGTTTVNTQTPASFSCTLTQISGSPVATQAPQTPSLVNYLLAISPTITTVPEPVITTSPAGRFVVSQMVPNGSNVTITGNYNMAGAVTLMAAVNISGQMVYCQVATTITQAAVPTATVYRFDRVSPPDIYYATSQTGPAGYVLKGAMFKVFTQPPSSATCTAIELNECLLPRSPNSVSFLTQAANCGGYPMVAQLGYTCGNSIAGTAPLSRMTNNIDFRYYSTASSSDISTMTSQGWRFEGVIGYVPLQ